MKPILLYTAHVRRFNEACRSRRKATRHRKTWSTTTKATSARSSSALTSRLSYSPASPVFCDAMFDFLCSRHLGWMIG